MSPSIAKDIDTRYLSILLAAICAVEAPAQTMDFAARDRAFAHGRIEYTCRQNFEDGFVLSRSGELLFAAGGRWKDGFVQVVNAQKSQVTFVRTPHWGYEESRSGASSFITFFDTETGRGGNPARNLVGQPCFALGLGLGEATGISRKATEEGEIEYDGGLGERAFKLVVRPDGSLAQLRVSSLGRLQFTWRYTGSIRVGNLLLPKTAEYISGSLGSPPGPYSDTSHSYEFKSIDLDYSPSDYQLAPKWFRPGVKMIHDDRVPPPNGWTYESLLKANGGKKEISPEKLQELTRASSSGWAKRRAELGPKDSNGLYPVQRGSGPRRDYTALRDRLDRADATRRWIVIGVLAAGVGLLYFLYRRARPTPLDDELVGPIY